MKILWIALALLVACSEDGGKMKVIASSGLEEASALEHISGKLWMLEDHGNKSALYSYDINGEGIAKVLIDPENNDWESLASDKQGNLYVGDFGNNDNNRRDLSIYKIDAATLNDRKANVSSRIYFNYPEQQKYPPKKTERLFDCEAFFEHNGYFYLFTKNRGSKSDGTFYVYSVPNRAGNHNARLLGTFKTCGNSDTCAITGADISPDGKTAILLTADTLYKIEGFDADFKNTEIKAVSLGHSSQKEGICFVDNTTVLIVDEQNKNSGGKIYEVKLDELEAKR